MSSRELMGDELLKEVKKKLKKHFGTKEQDQAWKNSGDYPELQDFLDDIDCFNTYTYFAFIIAHPKLSIWHEPWRVKAKLIMLPILQFVVPVLILKEQLRDYDWDESGVCPDQGNLTFRICGASFMLYSVWSVLEAVSAGCSRPLMRMASEYYQITGLFSGWILYAISFCVQVYCGIVLLFCLYFLMGSSTGIMDLCYNCFGINFLLDIDDEWVTTAMNNKGMKGAEAQFRNWRDAGGRTDTEILEAASSMRRPRKHIVKVNRLFIRGAIYIVAFLGYGLTLFFFGCAADW
mmetsp:Transcript_51624/g.95564  ORF Transcript_51624/g.95564 Transcript_51624/m.95564 type:complete len:291 (+) Transcript_51624:44-916(+)